MGKKLGAFDGEFKAQGDLIFDAMRMPAGRGGL